MIVDYGKPMFIGLRARALSRQLRPSVPCSKSIVVRHWNRSAGLFFLKPSLEDTVTGLRRLAACDSILLVLTAIAGAMVRTVRLRSSVGWPSAGWAAVRVNRFRSLLSPSSASCHSAPVNSRCPAGGG
jgi:hypothetical protein